MSNRIMVSLSAAALSILVLAWSISAQVKKTEPPSASPQVAQKKAKTQVLKTVATPQSDLQVLQSRVEALEKEIKELKERPLVATIDVPPVKRVPRDEKADSPESLQRQVNRLWAQIDKILETLDELTKKP